MRSLPIEVALSRARALAYLEAHPGAAGICRQCGCTPFNACVLSVVETARLGIPGRYNLATTCKWTDDTQTLCSNPACIAQATEIAIDAALQLPEESPDCSQDLPARED